MATENGTAMSDLELAEAWLLSTNFDMFCRTLGAKLGTAEYARKAVSELRTKNEQLLQEQEAIANALGLKQEPFMLAEHVSALVEHLDMANEERTEVQAENERLRRSILDYENDCAVLPEDYSVTEYVTHLRRELEEARSAYLDGVKDYEAVTAMMRIAKGCHRVDSDGFDYIGHTSQCGCWLPSNGYTCDCGFMDFVAAISSE